MVEGVHTGYKRELEMKGIGYKATLEGANLILNVGYSHPIKVEPLPGTKIEVPNATNIVVTGNDKQIVGQLAAVIRGFREPEPYLGKGIMYKGEHIRRKEGKTAKK